MTKGTDIGEQACSAVSCESLESKELQNKESSFYPSVYSLRRNGAYDEFAKYCNPKLGNSGRPEANYVSRVYSVAVVRYLQFMLHVMSFHL